MSDSAEVFVARKIVFLSHSPIATITFGEAAWWYLQANAGGDDRYYPPLIEQLDRVPLTEVDQATIDQTAAALYPNVSPSTQNRRVHGPISAVLKCAAKRGWCEHFRIKRPQQPKQLRALTSQDELDAFIKSAGPSLRRVALVLLSVEISIGEALALRWHQIDLANRRLRITAKRRRAERVVSISPEIAEMLARFHHRTGRLLRRPDGRPYIVKRFSGGLMRSACAETCKRAGIANITLGTLVRMRKHRKKILEARAVASSTNE